MRKDIWLKTLAKGLKKMPRAEKKRAVDFYQEMIEDRIEGGESEEEVIASLENPNDVAKKILDENGIKYSSEELEEKEKKKGLPIWAHLLLGVFYFVGFIVGISLFVCLFAVVIAFWACFAGVAIGAVACVLAIPLSIIIALLQMTEGGFVVIGGAILCAGLCALLAVGFFYLSLYTTKFAVWCCKLLKKRGER